MFDLIKKQWVGLVALVVVVVVLAFPANVGQVSDSFDDVTTFTNPIVFEETVAVEGQFNSLESNQDIIADDTLTVAESGKVVYIGTAGVDVTLPTAATSEGVTYRVVVSGNFAATNMTITGGAADATDDLIFGALEVAGAVVACSAEDTISFVNTAELPGDYVDLHSDGTNWYVTGQATTAGGITCTDAD
jgi:hypothetical protein